MLGCCLPHTHTRPLRKVNDKCLVLSIQYLFKLLVTTEIMYKPPDPLTADQLMNYKSCSPLFLAGSPSTKSGRRPRMSELQRRNPDVGQGGGPGSIDLQTTAREEGEGMENPVPPHLPLPSLEQLLVSPDPKQGAATRYGSS